MTRKASFSVEISTKHSTAHNNRSNPPKYLIGLEQNTQNYYTKLNGYENDSQFIQLKSQQYQKAFSQKMQQKQKDSMIKEAVISLEKHHDENHILLLFKVLGKTYGGHIPLEVSIHKDEGYFIKNGISYYPTKHIIKKGDKWFTLGDDDYEDYGDSKLPIDFFDFEVNILDFEKVYNYHTHVKFTMINMMGIIPTFQQNKSQTIKNINKEITEQDKLRTAKMTKKMMQTRLQVVATQLNMDYAPNPKTSRIKKSIGQAKEDHEVKRQMDISHAKHQKEINALEIKQKTVSAIYQSGLTKIISSLKAQKKITRKDIDSIRKDYSRQMIDSNEFYTKEDYIDLKLLFDGLKKELKDKNLTIEVLESKICVFEEETEFLNNRVEEQLIKSSAIIKEKDIYIAKLKEELKSTSSSSDSDNSELRQIRPQVTNLKEEIKKQKKDIKILKDLSFLKDEDGEFETYKKDNGRSYYRTYKKENEKLQIWKEKAIIFFKKVSSFFGFSNNLDDANNELDEIIEKKKKEKYSKIDKDIESSNINYMGGGMRL